MSESDGPKLRSEPSDAPWFDGRVQALLCSLTSAFDALRTEYGELPRQTTEIVLTTDLATTVRQLDSRVVGVEEISDFSVHRIGGQVAGKTMFRDTAHENVIIVLDAELFRSDDPSARVGEIMVVAHELAHALIGQVRAAGGPPMPACFKPWETSRWLARYAMEEYLADVLAEIVLGSSGTATEPDGTTRPLTSTDYRSCRSHFISAAQSSFHATLLAIHEYRTGDRDLESMWLEVQSATSQILIALAHAQAEADGSGDERAPATEPAADSVAPLHVLWSKVHGVLGTTPILAEPAQFARAEQRVLDDAGGMIVDYWRDLGLEFTPMDEGFHIAVAHPMEVWPRAPLRSDPTTRAP